MDERWYMVLDSRDDSWSWCVIGKDRSATRQSERSFACYSDAYEDARRHGCLETPSLATVEHIASSARLSAGSSVAATHERGRMTSVL